MERRGSVSARLTQLHTTDSLASQMSALVNYQSLLLSNVCGNSSLRLKPCQFLSQLRDFLRIYGF